MHSLSIPSLARLGGYGCALALAVAAGLAEGRALAQASNAQTPFMRNAAAQTPFMPGGQGTAPAGTGQLPAPGYDAAGSDGEQDKKQKDDPSFLGLILDGGVPDGAMLSLGYRPLNWLRVHAGAGTNAISPGIRVGATLVPFGIGPSLSLEAGHYFDGNANQLGRTVSGGQYEESAVLERVGYDFANAHLGLELGGDTVLFFAHGGFSYIRTTLYNIGDLFSEPLDAESGTSVSVNSNPTIVGFVPSAKLGFAVFFI